MTKRLTFIAATGLLLAGCGPRASKVTPTQRREAAALVSEAQFALSVHDSIRAEGLLEKAAALCPDAGDYWLDLGRLRVSSGKRAEAKSAYESALAAYQSDLAAKPRAYATAVLRQIYVLALLGRTDDARKVLAKARKSWPEDRDLRVFEEGGQLDQMLASPAFKGAAL